jgi:hypothetical protein
MAEAKSNNEQRGSGRRRYFRRSSEGRSGNGNTSSTKPAPPAKKEKSPERPTSGRLGRRRRRTRSRNTTTVTPQEVTTRESIVNLEDYKPPQGLFVYTHIARPGNRDSYEFRAEHFSKIGRRLEDYEIDLSKLFAEGGLLASPDDPAETEEE